MAQKCLPVRQLDRICFIPLRAIRHLPPQHQYSTRTSQPEVYDQPVFEIAESKNNEQSANVSIEKNKHHENSAPWSNGNYGGTISAVNSNSASLRRSFLFERNRSPRLSVVGKTSQSSSLSGSERGELLEQLEDEFRQSHKRNEVQRRHKPFDRKSVADPYGMPLPIMDRNLLKPSFETFCSSNGSFPYKEVCDYRGQTAQRSESGGSRANLYAAVSDKFVCQTDFMIRLRQVSAYLPATDSAASSLSAESSSSTHKLPLVRKTYIVPSGLLNDSSEKSKSTEFTPHSTTRVGKSKYVLCRADTFNNLSRKKGKILPDRKSLGHDVEMSSQIVDQITHELQERVYLEMQRLCEAEHDRRISSDNGQEAKLANNGYIKADALDPLLPDEIHAVRQLRMPDRFSKRTVYAFLDLEDGQHRDSSKVQYMDMPMLYLQPTNARVEPGFPLSIPLFKFGQGFPSELSQRIRASLQQSIHSSDLQQSTMIALCSVPNAVDPLDVEQDSGRSNELDTELGDSSCVQLFIALWRLRLWKGLGWTVPAVSDERQKKGSLGHNRRELDVEAETNDVHMRQEESAGQVLQGFDLVQGVMHGKWM
ncbi:hypothetical protein QFC19_002851 [Naganishia cerealis]|uniref:Uncharacterized protein n=1 Tax=Naganishia cerealis TaxID=610337 RepID=A0ACC2W818_9TREE|nr:hypothetical protein QFC19_002851 [Naganishia cerealis]